MSKTGRRASRTDPRLGRHGELIPLRGFSRYPLVPGVPDRLTRWRSHDGLMVVSSMERAELPGSGTPPQVGPSWLVSVSRYDRGPRPRDRRPTGVDVARVVECFAMPAFDEDNHHPGVARHLWCPVDPQFRSACECKVNEVTVRDGDYAWTTERGECRGCEYRRISGWPCPIHQEAPIV